MESLLMVVAAAVAVGVNAGGGYGGGIEKMNYRGHRIQIPIGIFLMLPMDIGNPPQRTQMMLSPQFGEIITIDKSCGIRRLDCPRYCKDEMIAHVFCPARCQVFTQQAAALYCRGTLSTNLFRYNGKDSLTAKYLGIKWSKRLQGTRKIYGNVWSDDIRFVFNDDDNNRYDEILKLSGQRIVSGDMFDLRKTPPDSVGTGIFGIAPTANSAALPLFSPPNIRRKIHSFANSVRSSELLRKHSYGQMTMTIGDLDKARCIDWEWFPSATNDSWTIEADATEYLGDTYVGKALINFDFSHYMHQVPLHIYKTAQSRGRYHQGPHFYCTRQLYDNPLTFIVGSRRLRLRSRSLTSFRYGYEGRRSECYVWMEVADEPKYTWEERKWTLSPIFFFEHCLAFDYVGKRIGVGVSRHRQRDLNDFPDGEKGPWQRGQTGGYFGSDELENGWPP